jgi:D-amino-acid dehydrogenase
MASALDVMGFYMSPFAMTICSSSPVCQANTMPPPIPIPIPIPIPAVQPIHTHTHTHTHTQCLDTESVQQQQQTSSPPPSTTTTSCTSGGGGGGGGNSSSWFNTMSWSMSYAEQAEEQLNSEFDEIGSTSIGSPVVLILGAGLVGLSTAYFLNKVGFDVRVIEARSESGLSTSFGNAASLTPSESLPWTRPSAAGKILNAVFMSFTNSPPVIVPGSTPMPSDGVASPAMLRAALEDGPATRDNDVVERLAYVEMPKDGSFPYTPEQIKEFFRVKVIHSPTMMHWGLQYFYHCARGKWQDTARHVYNLSTWSIRLAKQMIREHNLDANLIERPRFAIFENETDFNAGVEKYKLLQSLTGMNYQTLTCEECVEVEPVLSNWKKARGLYGGIMLPSDATIDPKAFACELTRVCREGGVRFSFNSRVKRIENTTSVNGSGLHAHTVHLDDGREVRGDYIVMCLGAWSPQVAADSDMPVPIPIIGMKGHSTTVYCADEKSGQIPINHVISLDAFHCYMAPLGNRVRITMGADFQGLDLSVDPNKAKMLRAVLATMMPTLYAQPARGVLGAIPGYPWSYGPSKTATARQRYVSPHIRNTVLWTGLRPSTPDVLPMIGKLPGFSNVFINAGHGTLGWTMACGSAAMCCELLALDAGLPVSKLIPDELPPAVFSPSRFRVEGAVRSVAHGLRALGSTVSSWFS